MSRSGAGCNTTAALQSCDAVFQTHGAVRFFDRPRVERLAAGFEPVAVGEFEEGKLPRRLFRVTMRKIHLVGY